MIELTITGCYLNSRRQWQKEWGYEDRMYFYSFSSVMGRICTNGET